MNFYNRYLQIFTAHKKNFFLKGSKVLILTKLKSRLFSVKSVLF